MSARRKPSSPLPCPCGSGRGYADCCGPAHAGTQWPATAEALMRSRYSAFALGLEDWLLATWHASTRPPALALDETPAAKWIGLQVRRHEAMDADHAVVEFVARYRVGGRAGRLHETSRFVREDGRWYYVDGDLHEG
ncbi:YchJ family protein [Pseudothauera rhizosphaerae]|uniref:UPF0225 protein E6O51_19365 n=1 Tax=Pseudothauera rhizosphaerae TaxID=2565932 RepID=A0A4S4AC83_9RHOO|nr:YchJ family metal-binding protein [Pseudothauera rhizosphaerae]THF56575.1 hypothetical protein E6O51_19365 [Pseudothauera rhizosphaerae]